MLRGHVSKVKNFEVYSMIYRVLLNELSREWCNEIYILEKSLATAENLVGGKADMRISSQAIRRMQARGKGGLNQGCGNKDWGMGTSLREIWEVELMSLEMGVRVGRWVQDNSWFWPRQVCAGAVHGNRIHNRSRRLRSWWRDRKDKTQKPALLTKAGHCQYRPQPGGRATSPGSRLKQWWMSPAGPWDVVVWGPKWKRDSRLFWRKKIHLPQFISRDRGSSLPLNKFKFIFLL